MGKSFTAAWLAGDPSAVALLPRAFTDPASRRDAVEAAARRPMRPEVHAALAAQEVRRPQTEARSRSLAALAEPGTVAIVTGQQVGLWLGPLYTLHKAVSAVVIARALAEETGRTVVPVFWLQTEDADFEEIRAAGLPGDDGEARMIALDDALGEAGARTSMWHRPLGDGVGAANDALAEALEGQRYADETMALVRRWYRPELSLGDAFAGLLCDLLGDHGIVVIDPRDPEMAPFSAPIHRTAIVQAERVAAALAERATAIEAAGCDVQVPIRDGAPLSCFHPDGVDGPRFRLVPATGAGRYEIAGDGRVVGEAEVLAALAADARHLSTTALLRPLLQDALLPTAGYVGGPGELAYFAELPPLYELFDQRMPMAIPRGRFRILGPTARRLCDQLGLTPDDAARQRHEVLAELGARRCGDATDVAVEASARVQAACDALLEAAAPLGDGGFDKAARRTAEGACKALEKLIERYQRAVAQDDAIVGERLDRLRGIVAPGGAPQERALAAPFFLAQHGAEALVEALFAAARPYEHRVIEVTP